jgi:hypothetical protein
VNLQDGVTPASTWTYNSTYTGYPTFSVTNVVTDPLGNDSVHSGSNIDGASCSYYENQVQYYTGTHTGGTLIKTVKTDHAFASSRTFASVLTGQEHNGMELGSFCTPPHSS